MFHSEELLRALIQRTDRLSLWKVFTHSLLTSSGCEFFGVRSCAGNKPSSNKTKPKPRVFDSFKQHVCFLRPSVVFTDTDFPENVVCFLLHSLCVPNLTCFTLSLHKRCSTLTVRCSRSFCVPEIEDFFSRHFLTALCKQSLKTSVYLT